MSRLIAVILLVTLFGSIPTYAGDDSSSTAADNGADIVRAEHADCGPYFISWKAPPQISFFAGTNLDGGWKKFLFNQKDQVTVVINDERAVPHVTELPGHVTIEMSRQDLEAAPCLLE